MSAKQKKPIEIASYRHTIRREETSVSENACPCGRPKNHDAGAEFFVSALDGGRHALVLGPYDTHEEALDNVQRGRAEAEKADPWVAFWSFGTLSIKPEHAGKNKGVLGR